ncbi:MAG: redoxin domain-containing protein [Anaerolineae bacterium]|nr:redoxin domain-containing protein [Anaerolineae bacterium]
MGQGCAPSPRILALIPAYNEAGRVGSVVSAVRERLPALVVDDGSADDTARLAEGAGATVLHQTPNQGKGAALRAGFRWALDAGYDAVITLDADGQHDPAEIPAFLDAFTIQGADLVIGERAFRQMPFPRNLSNTIGRALFSWALGQPVRDNQSGYRLLSRRMMEATLDSREGGFEFEVEMILTCVQRGYRLAGVPIRTIYEGEKSHIKPIPQTIHFMRVVWATRQAMRRARQREGRRTRWLPLLILPLIGVLGAALVLAQGDALNGDGEALPRYPTPAPLTFIPPTPLPTALLPTPPPLEDVIGAPLPDITLETLDGSSVRLRDLAGQIVVLNFWATWCAPCQREMPLLQQLQDERADVRVITITDPHLGQTERAIREFLARYTLTLPVALSEEDGLLFRLFEVAQLPTTVFVDREGIVRFRHLGELAEDDLRAALDQLAVRWQ